MTSLPLCLKHAVDPDTEYRALLGVFHSGWIVPRLALQLLGARMQHASGQGPEVMEAVRRAWAKHGERYLTEWRGRDERHGWSMNNWPWALSEFGPPRGVKLTRTPAEGLERAEKTAWWRRYWLDKSYAREDWGPAPGVSSTSMRPIGRMIRGRLG
jgi:hypothetical protein